MPNWCRNEIHGFTREMYKKYTDEHGNFDFNKINPRPEEINNTISGGEINECVAYYVLKNQGKDALLKALQYDWKLGKYPPFCINKNQTAEEMEEALLKTIGNNPAMYNSEIERFNYDMPHNHTPEEIGKYYYELRDKYGALDWYDWSCKHWGTKWNACDTTYDEKAESLYFTTPWCEPLPIFELLAKAEKDSDLTFRAEADLGGAYECVLYSSHDGILTEDSKETITFDYDDYEME